MDVATQTQDDRTVRRALQALSWGVAVADPESWTIEFENARFFQWFEPEGDEDDNLAARLTGLDADLARGRLAERGNFAYETEITAGPRTLNLSVELRRESGASGDLLIVEARDLSKQKEAEYMLDSYSRMVEKNTRELQKEKERVEKLLLNIMPKTVYEELRDFGTTTPQRFDDASVLMLDFVGFTSMAVTRDPSALVAELNDIFSAFDRIVELFGCDRIKTIGDAYMAVSGLPEPNPEHAVNIARVALRMRRYLERRNASHPHEWRCRIGVASGPVIGSIVGIQKYVYDIFGPAVNLSSRLEALCAPMGILVVAETARALENDFELSDMGEAEIRGFDTQHLYTLDGEHLPGR